MRKEIAICELEGSVQHSSLLLPSDFSITYPLEGVALCRNTCVRHRETKISTTLQVEYGGTNERTLNLTVFITHHGGDGQLRTSAFVFNIAMPLRATHCTAVLARIAMSFETLPK